MARPVRSTLVATVVILIPLVGMSQPQGTSSSSNESTQTPDGFDLQGHRGARGLAPENTMPAFRRALELGVTTLEMDVVISRDGTVVVSHEPWMAREKCLTPDGSRIERGRAQNHNLYQMSYDKIAAYDCGTLGLSQFPEQRTQSAAKPRLRDVLQMAETYTDEHSRGPVFYNVETKTRSQWDGTFHPEPATFVERVLAVVEEEEVAPRTTIQSFDPRTLEVAHEKSEVMRIALLVGWTGDDGLEENLNRLSFLPDVYSPDARLVTKDLVGAVHDRSLQIIPWTVNEPAAMKRLISRGVDGLITDYPDRAIDILREVEASRP